VTNILILDLETTIQRIEGRTDNSPKNPLNKCVSAHFGWLGWDAVDEVINDVYFHNEMISPAARKRLEEYLAKADVMVCHNAKFDCTWLLEMGFTLPPKIYCTMIAEYILSKGQRRLISLKETAIRRKTRSFKKSDLVDELFKSGTGFEAMPLATVLEYAEADVRATGEIYIQQQDDFARFENKSLITVVDLMNDMLMFLIEIERNGTAIDLDVLKAVEIEFRAEKDALTASLTRLVEEVMGDTPINLNSATDLSKVVYSRAITNRDIHRETFNIGTDESGRSLRPPRMSANQFSTAVRANSTIVKRTHAVCCDDCKGEGYIQKFKQITRVKNKKKYLVMGDPYKNLTRCKVCNGVGAIYVNTGITAGLKLSPTDANWVSINGFKTDKETLKHLIVQATVKNNLLAVDFLTKSSRLSAITVYLDSFVAGIQRATRGTGLLHPNFNQCIAATGRLSSGGGMSPNLQNQPKRGFPVRKAIVSRFKDGSVVECDYSGLEFRTACELSRDTQGMADIANGKDIHRQTASICQQKPASDVTKDERQAAKANTFLPLFGGTGHGEPEHIKAYFGKFYEIYQGIHKWHDSLMTGALNTGIVQTPSGRQYQWFNVVRTRNGRVSNATKILNYPVQGFSADIVQIACIRALKLIKEQKLLSKLILTVHDSIVIDTHPDELEAVKNLLFTAMTGVGADVEKRFGYKLVVPLGVEISSGTNWLEQTELVLTNHT
jgi:DNA polymerase I-like protein with 3'-5' exonuclease and polymerase domains